jgi:hypothetical protein
MPLASPHLFVLGEGVLDLRNVVAVSDTGDAFSLRVFALSGPQEGYIVDRATFEAAYQASLDAA